MTAIRVNLGPRSYDIAIDHGDQGLGRFSRDRFPKTKLALVIADSNTEHHAEVVAARSWAARMRILILESRRA